MVMAALAQGLPVFFIPEQIRIAAMRLDMIHNGCRNQPPFLFASDAPGRDASGKTSRLSATLSRSHAAPRSSVRPGTAVHVCYNIFSHTASALSISDTCTVSTVFLTFLSSPASKKDRWRSSLGPSFFSY